VVIIPTLTLPLSAIARLARALTPAANIAVFNFIISLPLCKPLHFSTL
jgi:hypothetical protein